MASPGSDIFAVIGLGSSIEPREQYVSRALGLLDQQQTEVLAVSTMRTTLPVGGVAKNKFLNGAALIRSTLDPDKLLNFLLTIEKHLGRNRSIRWDDRTIDLDILLASRDAEGQIPIQVRSPELAIPHPRLEERPFALIPTHEIAPQWLVPGESDTLTVTQIYAKMVESDEDRPLTDSFPTSPMHQAPVACSPDQRSDHQST